MCASSRQKRKAAPADNIKRMKKRQKITTPTAPTTLVRADALTWARVSLPDRLDDAEGFYDLEEIDGVEVVRDDRNHVMFRPKSSSKAGPSQGADIELSDENSWNGFDDADATSAEMEELDSAQNENESINGGIEKLKGILKSGKENLDPEVNFNILNEVATEAVNARTDVSAWKELSLSQAMLQALSTLGFGKPTSIQSTAIPPILNGQNVVGKAVTGSGKTLAFGIPIIEMWSSRRNTDNNHPIALILAPTRELAHQLERHLVALAEGLEEQPRLAKVTGGLSILKQQRLLQKADIIIATPGRLWEVLNESSDLIDRLKGLKFLVVDEADRLLSEGHFQEVEEILDLLNKDQIDLDGTKSNPSNHERQTLVFSATFHKGLHQKLAGKLKGGNDLLSNQQSLAYLMEKLPFNSKPHFIDANPTHQMSEQLEETVVESPAMEKDLYLYTLLLQHPNDKTLVFANSISAVKRLTLLLQTLTISALGLHSSMPQKSRLRALERFTAQNSTTRSVLVATDVASRGLDVMSIDLIIHYHVPRTADAYVHRSGRTARADASGRSILLCSPQEVVPTTRLITKVHANGKSPQVVHVEHANTRRIKPRVALAQRIVDVHQAQEKVKSKDNWLANAAEELGVDYDSEEFEQEGRRLFRGRGGDKAKKLQQKGQVTKAEVGQLKAELRDLLSKKVNLGVNEKYLAGGRVDVNALLEGKGSSYFLEAR